ncbi:hypothetical protein P4601_21590 [Peribacillus frigoritolerans]|uniref:hypothetical protein n=1 Tax=Peribacillus frigoritolerans TaxID=450367 RepID=UPI002E2298C1|nr:hypothetical protein [Peribacillus frigoritolerans]
MRAKATVTSGLIQEEPNFKRVLTLPSLVFYGLAYLIPTTIFDMYGIVSNITYGMFSLTHALTAIAILFTAFSYGSMVAAFPVSGSVTI